MAKQDAQTGPTPPQAHNPGGPTAIRWRAHGGPNGDRPLVSSSRTEGVALTDVAVVIPTLNRAALLKESIASALACQPAPAEIVVVDCGSSDDTALVVRGFGSDVEFIEKDLPNAAAARNVGLAATSAPYVGFP